ncbi:hypothetical protein E2320_013324 [Naja naja]|nr:hypothetical protein E2320_013324 [Naja naja]
MAFMVKSMVGGQLKNLTGGLGGEDKGEGDKSPAEAQGMTKEEYDEYQKQLVEEKDVIIVPCTMPGVMNEPHELAKMIEQDNEEEEEKDSVIGQLTNIQNLDLDSLKDKAQATIDDLKQSAEKCTIM